MSQQQDHYHVLRHLIAWNKLFDDSFSPLQSRKHEKENACFFIWMYAAKLQWIKLEYKKKNQVASFPSLVLQQSKLYTTRCPCLHAKTISRYHPLLHSLFLYNLKQIMEQKKNKKDKMVVCYMQCLVRFLLLLNKAHILQNVRISFNCYLSHFKLTLRVLYKALHYIKLYNRALFSWVVVVVVVVV